MASKCCIGLFVIPCMPVAQLVSSTSGPALPDEASLLCGDRGTWQRESPTEALATDRRDDEDDPGGFLSLPNLTLRWTQSGTDDDDGDNDDVAVFGCVTGRVLTLCSCWWPWTTHTHAESPTLTERERERERERGRYVKHKLSVMSDFWCTESHDDCQEISISVCLVQCHRTDNLSHGSVASPPARIN